VLDRLPNGVVVVDRALRLVYANPAARRLVGSPMPAGDPLPDPWPDFSLRDLAAGLFTDRSSSGRQTVEHGERVLCVEGLTAVDKPTATLLVEDVTERERARRTERQFVANAAHELRTPLAAIVSVVDVLESGAKNDPDTRDRFLAHIRAHTERLVRVATSLLVLARIQAGAERPRLDLVPLEPLLREVARGVVPNDSVTVAVRAPDELAVLGHRDLLHQALENVAANAIKHTREGEIVLKARDLGRTIEIEISDTGSGMERADAIQAFDRFYRSESDDSEGFGLGLAITEDAIHALGGTITLDSVPEVGTRVRIHLPSAKLVS
jgi:two-component system phosphate regulon sensor histidine kinase PhoR